MEKTYTNPQFDLVRTDTQNNVFFASSGTPGMVKSDPAPSLGTMSSTNGSW